MACTNYELEELRLKYESLQTEWDSQQEHLGRLQGDMYKLRNQLQHQSQFCASLGAVMGNLIWKASRIPQVVDMLLSGNKVGEFLNIVNGTLMSFMETYDSQMPGQCADESQFIMAMCGIVTNIAASPAGRQFLVMSPNGKELLESFVNILPSVPCPTGNCLKRLLLMALYNISINQYGLAFLQEQKDILPAISQSLQYDSTVELRLMSLRLLQSITYEIPTQQLLEEILENVSMDTVEEMCSTGDGETKAVAQEILDNIERARQKFGVSNAGRCQKTVPFNRCYFVQTAEKAQACKGKKSF
ncbi:heat shock factor 2-binding protein [Anabrus simplex]|uniref:heat shock factor 2-binding protein n=1 Tax=Anabrus simplex TaxID=316456 RepID=UPI0034DCDA5B